ncbi:MAG: Cys-tRNA(Pro) deacylase [Lachnospiraceae bacterium]|nr:Cys-tRNA(Pro) deacylase [Lachnospiraceae bacterium]
MKKTTEEKTNVQRLLEQKKIEYAYHCYADTPSTNGVEIARLLGEDERKVFKTLVTVGKSKSYYVFMIPVAEELDLKKAAGASGEKSIEMIAQKELLPLTGYVHGGCSPIGMKKQFVTFIHQTAGNFDTIIFSAGKVGYQVELPLESLQKMVPVKCADLIVKSYADGGGHYDDRSGASGDNAGSQLRYRCPCCGFYTLPEPAGGSYNICPVCYWEDDAVQMDDEDFEGGANKVSLRQARKNYEDFGASEERFVELVREATEEELEGID